MPRNSALDLFLLPGQGAIVTGGATGIGHMPSGVVGTNGPSMVQVAYTVLAWLVRTFGHPLASTARLRGARVVSRSGRRYHGFGVAGYAPEEEGGGCTTPYHRKS